MVSAFFDTPKPITATLAKWIPKCNAEMETRLKLDFEVPLTDEVLASCPSNIQSAAQAVGTLADGLTGGPISTEYNQTVELYATPDNSTPNMTLTNIKVKNLYIFRPTPKDGPSNGLFLQFSADVPAEGPSGDALVVWAKNLLKRTVFLRTFDVQGKLGLVEAEPEKPVSARKSCKDSAAGN